VCSLSGMGPSPLYVNLQFARRFASLFARLEKDAFPLARDVERPFLATRH